jgi:hypothetical protein
MWMCNYFEKGQPVLNPMLASGGKGRRDPSVTSPLSYARLSQMLCNLNLQNPISINYPLHSVKHIATLSGGNNIEIQREIHANPVPDQHSRKFFTANKEVLLWD